MLFKEDQGCWRLGKYTGKLQKSVKLRGRSREGAVDSGAPFPMDFPTIRGAVWDPKSENKNLQTNDWEKVLQAFARRPWRGGGEPFKT